MKDERGDATTANRILAFSVGVDGARTGQSEFATVQAPDGLAVDQGGNLYVAALVSGNGAVVVLSAAGRTIGSIPLTESPTNCAFGGHDYKTLFVTARTALYAASVPIPGL